MKELAKLAWTVVLVILFVGKNAAMIFGINIALLLFMYWLNPKWFNPK